MFTPAASRRDVRMTVEIDAGPLVRSLLATDRDSRYRLILRRGWVMQDGARALEALVDAMWRVVHDPDLRGHPGKAGLAQAARFSWDQSTAGLLTLLRDVAGRGEDGA